MDLNPELAAPPASAPASADPGEAPRPRRRLWSTYWHSPRKIDRLAPPFRLADVHGPKPTAEEGGRVGQCRLFDDVASVLHRDGTTTYRRHRLVVLWSADKMAHWDAREWRFDRRSWRVWVRRAGLVLPDGRRGRVRVKEGSYGGFAPYRKLSVTYAPLCPGATVELDEQTDYFRPDDAGPGMWGEYHLDRTTPCRRRRVTLAVARPFTLRYALHNGAPEPVQTQVGDYAVYCWDLRDLPGAEPDEGRPPSREIAPWIDYTTLVSWAPVAAKFDRDITRDADANKKTLGPLAERLTQGAMTERDRAIALYEYVARDVQYGRPAAEKKTEKSRPLGELTEELRGDCKDKSALLAGLLHTVGLPAQVALVSTARYGRRPLLPGRRFDHVLVRTQLGEQDVWLDAAAGAPYTFGELPDWDQGVGALLLDPRAPLYRPTPAALAEQHCATRVCCGRLAADGAATFDVRITANGDCGARFRARLIDMGRAALDRALRHSIGKDLPDAEVGEAHAENLRELAGDFVVRATAVVPALGRRLRDLLLLRLPWAYALRDRGYFATGERPHALQVPTYSVTDRFEIELPAGFTAYAVPDAVSAESPWGDFRCSVRQENGMLIGERAYAFRGGILPPGKYAEMRRFWSAAAAAETADIVLRTAGNTPAV